MEYSTILKLYKPQHMPDRCGQSGEYSTILKLYKPQHGDAVKVEVTEYSTIHKLYKPQLSFELENVKRAIWHYSQTLQAPAEVRWEGVPPKI